MRPAISRKRNRLPKSFPVGTTYVVEGSGGENGHLRVFCRYVVLPSGERINLGADFARPASPPSRRRLRNTAASRAPKRSATKDGTGRSGRAKKIIVRTGTPRQHGR